VNVPYGVEDLVRFLQESRAIWVPEQMPGLFGAAMDGARVAGGDVLNDASEWNVRDLNENAGFALGPAVGVRSSVVVLECDGKHRGELRHVGFGEESPSPSASAQ
jgi:hypothetical protein